MTGLVLPEVTAHVVYEFTYTFRSPSQCTGNWAEVSHGSTTYGVYRKGFVRSSTEFLIPFVGSVECRAYLSKPPNQLVDKALLMFAGPAVSGICSESQWKFNATTTHTLVLATDFTWWPPCGSGYYGTYNYAAVLYNGQWVPTRNAGLFSGWQWMGPPPPGVPCQPPAPPGSIQCDI